MNAACYLLGFLGILGLILVILDYRDHAKNKKKEIDHQSTFFPDEKQ